MDAVDGGERRVFTVDGLGGACVIVGWAIGWDGGGIEPTNDVFLPFAEGMKGGGGIAYLVLPGLSSSSKGFFISAVA